MSYCCVLMCCYNRHKSFNNHTNNSQSLHCQWLWLCSLVWIHKLYKFYIWVQYLIMSSYWYISIQVNLTTLTLMYKILNEHIKNRYSTHKWWAYSHCNLDNIWGIFMEICQSEWWDYPTQTTMTTMIMGTTYLYCTVLYWPYTGHLKFPPS